MGYEFKAKGFVSDGSEAIDKRNFEVAADNIIGYIRRSTSYLTEDY